MKYRILSNEELSHFDEDLKAFLIIHGIDGPLWEKMNRETPEKAIELVELFSDVVLQRVYENISYLEFRSPDTFAVFHLEPEQQSLVLVKSLNTEIAELSTPEQIQEAVSKQIEQLEFFRSNRSYPADRELAVHQLLDQGCVLSDESIWKMFDQMTK
jgi:hypothetical protein